jgi:hypothetical protein
MASRLPEQKLTVVDGGKNVHLGGDTMPRTQYVAAREASVLEQLEDLTPAGIRHGETLLRDGVMIRSKESFGLDDQRERWVAGFQFAMTDYPWFRLRQLRGGVQRFVPLRSGQFVDGAGSWLNEPGSRILIMPARTNSTGGIFAYASEQRVPENEDWETLPSTTRRSPKDEYPNREGIAGEGCLRFASGNDSLNAAESFTFCRRTSQGEYNGAFGEDVILTAYLQENGTRTKQEFIPGKGRDAEHRDTSGPGDYIRLSLQKDGDRSCVAAYSAAAIGGDGAPVWREHTRRCFPRALPYRGILGQQGSVLFVGTKREGNPVTAGDLRGRDVSGDYKVDDNSWPKR